VNKKSVRHLSEADPVMAKIAQHVGPLRFKPRLLPPFQSLVQAIAYQQLSGKAASTILSRFRALFSENGFPTPDQVLSASFERLRSSGLSRPKVRYILEIAERTRSGHVPTLDRCHKLTDQELLETLTEITGVGRWTAEMLLIFNLGRPDVLPVHDLGVRRGFQIAYKKRKLPEPEQLEKFGERWRPYRTTAALYLWRAADFLEDGEW
jgi:DNA-3-methyladenine glycosylase II